MPAVFETNRRVEFCETDAAGIAHFSSFVCYMEQAEHRFLRSLGTSVVQPLPDQDPGWHMSWPRVHLECDYAGTACFEDELAIRLQVLKLGVKSITYGFEFFNRGQRIATGKLVAVCCRVKSGQPLKSIPIPAELASKLQDYLQDAESAA